MLDESPRARTYAGQALVTVKGTRAYQACDDRVCFKPVSSRCPGRWRSPPLRSGAQSSARSPRVESRALVADATKVYATRGDLCWKTDHRLLLGGFVAAAQTRDARPRRAHRDRAARIGRVHQNRICRAAKRSSKSTARPCTTSEALEALSWLGRAALAGISPTRHLLRGGNLSAGSRRAQADAPRRRCPPGDRARRGDRGAGAGACRARPAIRRGLLPGPRARNISGHAPPPAHSEERLLVESRRAAGAGARRRGFSRATAARAEDGGQGRPALLLGALVPGLQGPGADSLEAARSVSKRGLVDG